MSIDERLRIWGHNEVLAMNALSNSGRPDDIIIVLDSRDSLAGGILRALSESQGTDFAAHEAKVSKRGEIPVGILLVQASIAARLLERQNPTVAEALRTKQPREGHVFALIIAAEGTVLLMPKRVAYKVMGSA